MDRSDNTMRVAIDARDLNRHHLRGQGKYTFEIISRLGRFQPVQWELFGDRPDLPFHCPEVDDCKVRLFDQRGYRFHAWEQFYFPRRLRRVGAQLVHCTGMRLPYWQPLPTIVTVHDAMPWRGNEECWPRGFYTDWLIPRALRKSAAIITVSENSKKDIISFWPELGSKLFVIPNGVSDLFFDPKNIELRDEFNNWGLTSPYLLYIGGTAPRKRLDWAIRVFDALDDESVLLAICGVGTHFQQQLMNAVPEERRARIRLLPFIEERLMPALIGNALAVLYPTLYEGFGLPVIESQATGTPIIFNDIGCFSELNGPSTIALPIEDLQRWVAVCRRTVYWRKENMTPNESARKWARRFSWDESARKHSEVYCQVAESKHWRKG